MELSEFCFSLLEKNVDFHDQLEYKGRKVVRTRGRGGKVDPTRGCLPEIQRHVHVIRGGISEEDLNLMTKYHFFNYVYHSDYAISLISIDLQ